MTRLVASFAELCRRIVVLRAQALHTQAPIQHEMGRTRSTFQRSLALARAAEVMALLATKLSLKEPFRALGMALASSQLPSQGTLDALVSARTQARLTR